MPMPTTDALTPPMPTAPATPEALYTGLGAAPPAAAPAPVPSGPPDTVDATSVPAAAPVTPTAAPPPQPSAAAGPDDATLDTDLNGWIDSQLLDTLRRTAKGEMSTAQVWALAGQAAANPESARQALALRQRDTESARQLLTNLQTQAQIFRRTGVQQKGMYDRTILEGRNQQVKEDLDAANQIGVALDPTPDLTDDAKYSAWQTAQHAKIAGKKREGIDRQFLAKATQLAVGEMTKAVTHGADPATLTPEWLAAMLKINGATDDQIAAIAPDIPLIMKTAQSEAAQARAKLAAEARAAKAKADALTQNMALMEQKLAIMQQNADTGKLGVVATAYASNNVLLQTMQPLVMSMVVQADRVRDTRPELAGKIDELVTGWYARLPGLIATNEGLGARVRGGLDEKQVFRHLQEKFTAGYSAFQQAYPELAKTPDEAKLWLEQNVTSAPAEAFWNDMIRQVTLESGLPPATVQYMVDQAALSIFGHDVVYQYPVMPYPPGATGFGPPVPGQEQGGALQGAPLPTGGEAPPVPKKRRAPLGGR